MMRDIAATLAVGLLVLAGCSGYELTAPGADASPDATTSDSPADTLRVPRIGPVDAPAVTIYDINVVAIDELTVDAGDPFTLIGYVIGNSPLYYAWLLTAYGETTSILNDNLYLIDYSISTPGDYTITLKVIDGNGLEGTDAIAVTVLPVSTGPMEVSIDIKPGSDPNSVNLGSNGGVPVAIFSTADFDATTVDPATVKLADAAVRVVGRGKLLAAPEDVNGDGLLDLVVHIDTQGLDLTDGDVVAELTGQTYDGQAIHGSDAIRVVP